MIFMQGESEGATLAPSGFPSTFKWEFFPLLSGEKGVSSFMKGENIYYESSSSSCK